MRSSTAAISVIAVLGIVIELFVKGIGYPGDFEIALEKAAFSSKEPQPYAEVRNNFDSSGTLPGVPKFDVNSSYRDFYADITTSEYSGYYSSPRRVYFDAGGYDIYYTTDGSLPTANSLKYNPESGIAIDDNTFLCMSAEKNGRYSDVEYFSYVILKNAYGYENAYGYNSLDSYDQHIYRMMYDSIENYQKEIRFGNRNLTYSKVQRLLRCINYDNPLLFQTPLAVLNWRGTPENVTAITLVYDYKKDKADSLRERVISKADKILQNADGAYTLVSYIDSIRTQIMTNAVYDDSLKMENSYEAAGVLLDGAGVCESYSRAFQYLCQRIGVDCILVVGQSRSEGHMWNMLCLDDDWYHMDLTWDDDTGSKIYYDFFNINDYKLSQYGDRTIDPVIRDTMITRNVLDLYNVYEIPTANGEKYSYTEYVLHYQ